MRVLTHPNSTLRTKCNPVVAFDDQLRRLVDAMAETMYESRGVGLAAPQVGESLSLILVDPGDGLLVMANPVVEFVGPPVVLEEGCLSLPDTRLFVSRPAGVVATYDDAEGRRVVAELDGWAARIVQHEVDHVNGVLMIDRVGPLARRLATRRQS